MIAALFGLCVAVAVLALGAGIRPVHGVRRVVARASQSHPRRRWTRWSVGAVVVAAGVAVLGPLVAAAGIVAAAFVARWRAARAASTVRRSIESTYPDAIDLVVLAVRAGYLPGGALLVATAHVPPQLRPAFASVSARVAAGERFADALAALDELGPIARPLIDTFAAADRYGLALAPVLERLAFDARQQRRRAADAAARQLPVRLSMPLVLCTLPAFVLLAIVPLLLGAFSSLHTP
ncbi:MAG: gspF [Ilumatobacteraceae bacterium]|jgi:Flp pilus assembly protein TadB|nr:gspF [Ilumatobacteraceae bacterium]